MKIAWALWRPIFVLVLVGGTALVAAGPAAAMRPRPDCAGLLADMRFWGDKASAAFINHNAYLEGIYMILLNQAYNDASSAGCL